MHTAWSSIIEVPYCLSSSSVKFQGYTWQKTPILTQVERFWTGTAVWIHRWYLVTYKAWSGMEELPYYFSRSSVKFQGHKGWKTYDLVPIWGFLGCDSFVYTDGHEMTHIAYKGIEEVSCWFSRPSVKFQGHRAWKFEDLDLIWARLLGRSQLSNPSDSPCHHMIIYSGRIIYMCCI